MNVCNVNVARIARKTLLGLPGKEKREKAKKQEIRRVHNSNPLLSSGQNNDDVDSRMSEHLFGTLKTKPSLH